MASSVSQSFRSRPVVPLHHGHVVLHSCHIFVLHPSESALHPTGGGSIRYRTIGLSHSSQLFRTPKTIGHSGVNPERWPKAVSFHLEGRAEACLRPCAAVLFVRIEGGRAHVVQLVSSGSRGSCRPGDRNPDVASAEDASKRRSQRLLAPFVQASFRNTGPGEGADVR